MAAPTKNLLQNASWKTAIFRLTEELNRGLRVLGNITGCVAMEVFSD
ncbi:MAG: hypothetical protein WC285_06550 [Candidatus Gracilibacteria bacterium]